MYKRKIASGAVGSTIPKRRRLAALCGAAIAAALFTPVPATADVGVKPVAPHIAVSAPEPVQASQPIARFAAAPVAATTKTVPVSALANNAVSTNAVSTNAAPAVAVAASSPRTSSTTMASRPEVLAQSLISTGMVGIGLALGGIVIVTYRRRQW